MSRVYFHSPSGDAELRGSERAYAGWITGAVGIAALGLDRYRFLERDARFIDAGYPLHDADAAETALRAGGDRVAFTLPSGRYGSWEVLLNTCLALGNDPLCFMARMHAQCEIHAWVSGEDRAWLASVISAGRRLGLMRDGQGWGDVVTLLLARADEPVVMSYSVCDQFPNQDVAQWTPPTGEDSEPNLDAWYDLDKAERWRLALAGVREMQFGPGTLRTPFGHCKTAFDVRREIDAAR